MSLPDSHYMSCALELARLGRYTTDPNPCVGCVIVKDDAVAGTGWHRKAGEPHAEIIALEEAGNKAEGATMYVTLEPCCHTGKTGPCADAVIASGISRLVVAMVDPNPSVSSKGLEKIKQSGIEVVLGILEEDAKQLNPGFIHRMKTGRPFLLIKMATSLDGRTAMENGQSQWITGREARLDVQKLRASSSAVLSSAQTVMQDDASLDVRVGEWEQPYYSCHEDGGNEIRQPVRIILDRQAKLTGKEKLFKSTADVLLVTGEGKAGGLDEAIESVKGNAGAGSVDVLEVPVSGKGLGLDLEVLLEKLEPYGLNSILVEAGPTLAGQWIEQDLFDEIHLYMAPVLMGSRGKPAFLLEQIHSMEHKVRLKLKQQRMIGNDMKMIFTKE